MPVDLLGRKKELTEALACINYAIDVQFSPELDKARELIRTALLKEHPEL